MNFSDIPADIEIFGSGYCPDEYFLSYKNPYIIIQTVSRWSEFNPYFYCTRNGIGHKAFLCTFDKEGNEECKLIETFIKEFPKEVMERLKKMGYCSFK